MLMEILVGALLLIAFLTSVRVVPEGERLGVVRLGRFAGMRGPGLVFVLPLADRTVRVDLQRDIPTWRSMPAEALERAIERRTTTLGL
jgi:regulator of protease activity HflC (stomatin/prohibitin superfamily)